MLNHVRHILQTFGDFFPVTLLTTYLPTDASVVNPTNALRLNLLFSSICLKCTILLCNLGSFGFQKCPYTLPQIPALHDISFTWMHECLDVTTRDDCTDYSFSEIGFLSIYTSVLMVQSFHTGLPISTFASLIFHLLIAYSPVFASTYLLCRYLYPHLFVHLHLSISHLPIPITSFFLILYFCLYVFASTYLLCRYLYPISFLSTCIYLSICHQPMPITCFFLLFLLICLYLNCIPFFKKNYNFSLPHFARKRFVRSSEIFFTS